MESLGRTDCPARKKKKKKKKLFPRVSKPMKHKLQSIATGRNKY